MQTNLSLGTISVEDSSGISKMIEGEASNDVRDASEHRGTNRSKENDPGNLHWVLAL